MSRFFIVYVYFTTMICVRSYEEDFPPDEKVRIFSNNEIRKDFANLLNTLILLNEHRLNIIKQINLLEDMDMVNGALKPPPNLRDRMDIPEDPNLVIFLVTKNQPDYTRRSLSFMDSYDDDIIETINPAKRKWYEVHRKDTPDKKSLNTFRQHNAVRNKNPGAFRNKFSVYDDKPYQRSNVHYIEKNHVFNTFQKEINQRDIPSDDYLYEDHDNGIIWRHAKRKEPAQGH